MAKVLHVSPRLGFLEAKLVKTIQAQKQADVLKPVHVLVGSRLVALYLQRMLALGGLSHANIRFLTLPELASKLAGPAEMPLSPVVESYLISKLQPQGYFKPVSDKKGFRQVLRATFRDLRDGRFDSLTGPICSSSAKLSELAALYGNYLASLRGFCDEAQLLKNAAGARPVLDKLVVYGLYDFTEAQRSMLQAVFSRASVEFFFLEHEFSRPTLDWLLSLGFSRQDDGQGGGARDSGVAPAVLSAATEVREVVEIAREIFRLCRDQGYHLHDIGIALRNPEVYTPLFRQVFESFAIPAFLHKGESLVRHPLGRSMLLLLDLVHSDYPREQVLEWMKFADLDQAGQWERISVEAGIIGGKQVWRRKLSALKAKYKRRQQRALVEPREESLLLDRIKATESLLAFVETLFQSLDGVPKSASWHRYAELVAGLVRRFHRQHPDLERISGVLETLAQIDAVDNETDFGTFKQLAARAFEQVAWHVRSFQRGAVSVYGLMVARGVRFKVVFVPGMVEKSFPAQLRQDPILLDWEREKINACGAGRLPLKGARLLEEDLLFRLLCESATERIIFSYPRMEAATGRERIASAFLLGIGDCGLGIDKRLRSYREIDRLPGFRKVGISEVAPERAEDALRQQEYDLYCIQRSSPEEQRELGRYLMRADTWLRQTLLAQRTRFFQNTFTVYDGVVSSQLSLRNIAAQFGPDRREFAATQLETYATCPYRFFLKHALGLDPMNAPETIQRISPMDRGSLVHDILRDFYRGVTLPLDPARRDELFEELEATISRHFARAEEEGITGYRLFWEMDRSIIREDLRSLLDKELGEQEWVPSEFEVPFTEVTLDSTAGRLRFKGRIDRIDRNAPGSVRVVDYKTGGRRKHAGPSKFGGGRALQLPIYLLAAQQRFGLEQVEESRAEYYYISRLQGFQKESLEGINWNECLEELGQVAGSLVQGILLGRFFPFPDKNRGNCGSCDFVKVCDRRVETLFERKREDIAARAFVELKEEHEPVIHGTDSVG